jgi:HPt (histidine-containing phosphotransfer) domain-containing protein
MEAKMDSIDQEKLFNLYGSQDTATDIIHMFIDKSENLIKEIEAACNENNDDTLAKICHKGIGQSRYIAAPLIEEALRDIQKSQGEARANYLQHLKQMVQSVSDAYS